ncbi:MAG: hypothetical protein M3434_05440 [Gemmatimonadota bacterium]|nr:hypothetical protein [Gemmatimonadota bacterium]
MALARVGRLPVFLALVEERIARLPAAEMRDDRSGGAPAGPASRKRTSTPGGAGVARSSISRRFQGTL